MHRRVVIPVLAGWTLFVWGTRLRNLAGDEAPAGDKVAGALVAGSFVVLGGGVLVAWWRRRPAATRRWVGMLALWTPVIWLPRLVLVLARDHSGVFKVVHVVIGVVSMALAAAARYEVSVLSPAAGPSRSPARSR